jgi:phospholipase C
MALDRRSFLKAAAAGAGLTALGVPPARADFVNLALPTTGGDRPAPASPVDCTVVLMMENRSTDHYLGWRGAETRGRGSRGRPFDGVQDRAYPDLRDSADPDADAATAERVPTEHWGAGSEREDYAGCGHLDPGHGWGSGRVQMRRYDSEEPQGFLTRGAGNDEFAVSFYEPADIPVIAELARGFTSFDRYFCSLLAPTFPNREYLHSCQSGGLKDNSLPPQIGMNTGFEWPTIWTALDLAGVSWKYYFCNLPTTGLWGTRHAHNSRFISDYYADAAAGTLPQVAFVDPWVIQPEGLANDDHPHADIRLGQQFISDVLVSFMQSPQWRHGAFFLTYDEWGGFWDHVMPPRVDDPRADSDPADDFGQVGFRVPTLLASPWAAGGRTDHGLYDHTSIVKFIETNYGLTPLHHLDPMARDAGARNVGAAFDFGAPPVFEVDVDRFRYRAPATAHVPCAGRGHEAPASDLYTLAQTGWFDDLGFPLGHRFEDTFTSTLTVSQP